MTRNKFGRLVADVCPQCGKNAVAVVEIPRDTGTHFACRTGFTICVEFSVTDLLAATYYVHPEAVSTEELRGI